MSTGSGRGRQEIDIELPEILPWAILFGDDIGWVWRFHSHTRAVSQKPYKLRTRACRLTVCTKQASDYHNTETDWRTEWDTGGPAGGGKTDSRNSARGKGSQCLTFTQLKGQRNKQMKSCSQAQTHKQTGILQG